MFLENHTISTQKLDGSLLRMDCCRVTTYLCFRYLPDAMDMFDFSAERVTKSVHESLERMGVDYIDCIQVSYTVIILFYPPCSI